MCSTFRPPCFAATHSHLAREDVFSEDAAKAERQGHSGSRERHGVQKRDAIGLFDRNHGPARAPSGSLRAVARVLVCHRPPRPPPGLRIPSTAGPELVPTLHAALCSGGPVGAEGEGTSRSGTMDSKQRDKTVGPKSPNWKSSSDNVCSSPCVRSREPCAPQPSPTRRAHCAGFSTGSRRQSI